MNVDGSNLFKVARGSEPVETLESFLGKWERAIFENFEKII